MRKECRDFFFLLSACYFHPERKYSSEEVKELAKQAMISLWQRKSITVWSIKFEHEYIRDIIINKMMPEELDDAIRRWKEHGETSAEQLYHQLFLTVVLANALELFHKVMRCECIPIECQIKVRVVA